MTSARTRTDARLETDLNNVKMHDLCRGYLSLYCSRLHSRPKPRDHE